MENQTLTLKMAVPNKCYPRLNEVLGYAKVAIVNMLQDRTKSSSKYYTINHSLPCNIVKSLLQKYQRNKKCKQVSNPTLPICSDKEKQVRYKDGNLYVASLFGKEGIPVVFPHLTKYIQSVEFFKKRVKGKNGKRWFVAISYKVENNPTPIISSFIGVDRNEKGNVATIANIKTGQVIKIGPSARDIKQNYRNRRAKIAKKGKTRLLKKLSKKQLNRTKDINHKVSRQIVDYAKKHRCAIVMEDLSGIKKPNNKIKHKVEKSQWSYTQLDTLIKYKASLLGIPIYYINPRNTSKMCSRCGTINTPNGKSYKCLTCGHFDHRDANAAFNIAKVFLKSKPGILRGVRCGLIDNPLTRKEHMEETNNVR